MSDGANLGITAEQALATILGGEPELPKDDRMTPEQFAEWVRGCPDAGSDDDPDSYSQGSRLMAKWMLQVMTDDPKREWSLSSKMPANDVYKAAKVASPREALWAFEGCTGFMVGWAFNAARSILTLPPVQNPAILTLTF